MQKKIVVIVAGPTASGKSKLAIDIAQRFSGVVLNADSMQIYQNTPVLSACPSNEDKAVVSHRLYEIMDASHNGNVVDWLDMAVAEIKDIWCEDKIPVVVGGTGLYIDNLINGTTPIPETPEHIKEKVSRMFAQYEVEEMHARLKEHDEITALRLNPKDTTRIRRAWEVFLHTGIALSKWHQKPMIKKLEDAQFVIIKIIPSKEELDVRCYARFDWMLERGAVEEVRKLAARKLDCNLPAMKALGVPELLDYVEGKVSLEEAAAAGKLHTRQYAKRQITWFKNQLDADIVLDKCYVETNKEILDLIEDKIEEKQ